MSLSALDFSIAFAGMSGRPSRRRDRFDCLANTLEVVAEHVSFSANEEIYAEEDLASYLYKVARGTVRICRLLEDGRRQIVAFLMPGDYFGLELGDEHLFSAEAVEDVELMLFERRSVQGLAEQNNSVALRLWEMTADSVRRLQEHILLLGRMNVRAKVATFLLSIAERSQVQRLYLSMTRVDIGDHLGLTLETVSRTIRQLEQESLISLDGARSVCVRDVAGLKRIAA